MTRFARARGSKSSNEKTPEDGTPWEVMKEQLLKAKMEGEDSKKRQEAEKQRIENYENFLKDQRVQKRTAAWCDFPEAEQTIKSKSKGIVHDKEQPPTKKKKKFKDSVSSESFSVNNENTEKPGKEINNKQNLENKQNNLAPNETGLLDSALDTTKKKKRNKLNEDFYQPATNTTNPTEQQSSKKKKKKKGDKFTAPRDNSLQNDYSNFADETVNTNNSSNIKKQKKNNNYVTSTTAEGADSNNQNVNKQNKKKKKMTLFDGKPARRKEINDKSFQLIINTKEVELIRFDGFPIMKKDAERLTELRNSMIKKGIPKSEVQRTMKLERRRAEKALARLKREVCYNCRKGGHNLSDCPDLKSKIPGVDAAEGVCFKCGSTEHRQFQCKVQRDKEFRFASCFICKEQGHIARQCPDNPKGLYPNGGNCKLCGDVTHLRKDCPTANSKKEDTSVKLQTLESTDNLEDIGVQSKTTAYDDTAKKPKKIKF